MFWIWVSRFASMIWPEYDSPLRRAGHLHRGDGTSAGEKLYEELLVRTEELDKTENRIIFIEKDTPLPAEEIEEKLRILQEACDTGDDARARSALHQVVPSFKEPQEANSRQTIDQKKIAREYFRQDCAAKA